MTVGTPSGEPVLILHGTSGSGAALLSPEFGGELFGPGQPLDASKYYIILPDGIGHGKSSKPSDGLRAKFPSYNYDDMVEAQYRLVSEGLKLPHLRLVLGFSMGGMHSWLWGEKYPGYMDALVPMASQPAAMMARSIPNAPQIGRIHWCKTQRRCFEVFLLQHTAGPYIRISRGDV